MNFKRYIESSNTWVDSHYIKGTDTDTITTLPATIYPLAQTVTLGMKGNTAQNGTPSPSNPVDVNGVGERTANWFDETYPSVSTSIKYRSIYVGNGEFTGSSDVPIINNKSSIWLIAGQASSGASGDNTITNAYKTVTSIDGYVTIAYRNTDSSIDFSQYHVMLNAGSQPLSYEPHGYKIPILSNSVTTNVYLGEVQTTRQIRKLVLTGEEEGWIKQESLTATDAYQNYNLTSDYLRTTYYVTHMPVDNSSTGAYTHGYIGNRITLCMDKSLNLSDTTSFKTWLASEYSAGHPVILYYVLATATTGIVNEPLQKIGSYSDSISGISLSVTAGANTLDVSTTVKPSEVSAAFNGWHPVSAAHERSGGAWD